MKEQHKIWQNQWRQIIGKPINVDIDLTCDFDLHFDIWDLEKDDFFKLFKLFPKGQQLAERAYQLRWGDLSVLKEQLTNEQQIINEAKKSINDLQLLFPTERLKNPAINIRYGNNNLRLELLSQADPVSVEVDDEFSTIIKKANGEPGYNSYFFLREPMYRLASSYTPAHWILWTLTNLSEIDPYTPLLRLYYNNIDVALTKEGVLIFKLIDDTLPV